MIKEIRNHIERKFSQANIEEYPFPHLIIEGIFPDEIYKSVVEYNPFRGNPGLEWMSKEASSGSKMSTPYYARKQISLQNSQVFNLSPDEMVFWDSLRNCFLSDNWFKNLVLEKYKTYFSLRFGSIIEDVDFLDLLRSELFLQRHEIGFHIGPHTDIPPRIFTCIFSFARSSGFEEFGTQLLRPKDRMVRCWGNNHYDHEGFEVHKIAPYKPNNFLLFFKTRQSFHAVKAIDASVPDQRFGMQFQLYEPAGGLFRDLSEPDILETRISRVAT